MSADQKIDNVKIMTSSENSGDNDNVYSKTGLDRSLRQCEVISRSAQYIYNPATGRVIETYHDFAIVAEQDCDLERDFEDAEAGKPSTLNGVLMYEAFTPDRAKGSLDGKTLKDAMRNVLERYAFVEACSKQNDLTDVGFEGLIIDFRRHFTIPPREVYRQIALLHGAQRRSRLASPYSENLQNRLAHYLQRVALPRPHIRPKSEGA